MTFRLILIALLVCLKADLYAQSISPRELISLEIGFGKLYLKALDVQANNADGWGPITFYPIENKLFKNPRNVHNSAFGDIKVIFRNQLVLQTSIYNYTSGYNNSSLKFPETGLRSINFNIVTLGAGYQLIYKKFRFNYIGNVAYRNPGREGYTVSYRTTYPSWPEPIDGGITYENPWGLSINNDLQYQVSKYFKLGCNLGFYLFPFEQGTLKGNDVHVYFPQMVENTKPAKQLFIASFYFSYRFAFKSHKQN